MMESWDNLAAILPWFLLRCGAAVLCGGLIGVERELRRKPAGFRTNILICLGSTIYMAVGLLVTGDRAAGESDPARVAAQVVTGIGFIGAGTIIQSGTHVTGLTSAATIWVVASIGLVAGAGYPVLAVLSAILVVITLAMLGRLEARFFEHGADDYRSHEDRR